MTKRDHRRLRYAVKHLPERQRQVVRLIYWKNMSKVEVCKKLGIHRSTLRDHIDAAFANIWDQLCAFADYRNTLQKPSSKKAP